MSENIINLIKLGRFILVTYLKNPNGLHAICVELAEEAASPLSQTVPGIRKVKGDQLVNGSTLKQLVDQIVSRRMEWLQLLNNEVFNDKINWKNDELGAKVTAREWAEFFSEAWSMSFELTPMSGRWSELVLYHLIGVTVLKATTNWSTH